ncbi:helix-turn-helix domain-containing protein [Streptomyces sp. KL2]|uniref:helix-turn-helix domain-containing protein n=1 Tax=Streptomyces sp. KL2 TaxID=3050126 RepID=UPI0039787E10
MPSDEPTSADFSGLLRNALLEATEGASIRTMARKIDVSVSTLSRILAGTILPPPEFLEKIDKAVGLSTGQLEQLQGELIRARQLRRTARIEQERVFQPSQPQRSQVVERRRAPVPKFGQPDPLLVSTPQDLAQALQAVRVWAGSPSLRQLVERSGGRPRRTRRGLTAFPANTPGSERLCRRAEDALTRLDASSDDHDLHARLQGEDELVGDLTDLCALPQRGWRRARMWPPAGATRRARPSHDAPSPYHRFECINQI